MHPNVLAEELDRDPFVPLRIYLTDGHSLDVRNPGLCFIARLALYVFNAKPRHSMADDVEVVSLRNIVSVETVGNGQVSKPSRRKRRR